MVWDVPILVDHTVEAGLQALQWGDAKATLTSPQPVPNRPCRAESLQLVVICAVLTGEQT